MLFIQGYGIEDLSFGVFKNGSPETGPLTTCIYRTNEGFFIYIIPLKSGITLESGDLF
jgi:hypothetical protein